MFSFVWNIEGMNFLTFKILFEKMDFGFELSFKPYSQRKSNKSKSRPKRNPDKFSNEPSLHKLKPINFDTPPTRYETQETKKRNQKNTYSNSKILDIPTGSYWDEFYEENLQKIHHRAIKREHQMARKMELDQEKELTKMQEAVTIKKVSKKFFTLRNKNWRN